MSTKVTPIRRRKLSDDVVEQLLADIRQEGLRPGDVLPSERQLMERFEVGRPAIREAMQSLQRRGVVAIRHGERPRVAAPSMDLLVGELSDTMRHLLTHSPATMEHLKEARVTFETELARIAAKKRSNRDVERLRSLHATHESVRNQPERFMSADAELHRAIASISGNPIFESLSYALFNWLMAFHVEFVRKPGTEQLTLDEHAAIIAAIEAGDPREAGRRMADHLNRANALYHSQNLSD